MSSSCWQTQPESTLRHLHLQYSEHNSFQKMNTKCLSLLFLLISLLLHIASSSNSSDTKQIPAMYVFGDSLVDSGNNNYLPGKSNAIFPPYGIDFGDGKPTGRWTNGRTVVDYFGEKILIQIHYLICHLFNLHLSLLRKFICKKKIDVTTN